MLDLHARKRAYRWNFCWMVLLLLGASSRGASGQIEPASAELVDSMGTVVGPVLDYNGPGGGVEVAVLIDGHTTILEFRPDSVDTVPHVFGFSGVFFASADCTGQGFAPSFGPEEFLEPQAIGGPQNTFFAGPPGIPGVVPFAYNSRLQPGQTCSAESGTLLNPPLPVNAVRTLTPPWQPPFRLVNVSAPGPLSVPAVSPAGLAVLVLILSGVGVVLLRLRRGTGSVKRS